MRTAAAWSAALEPLAELIERRYLDFLPRQVYPIRTGVHPNTAFGLTFALDYARALGRYELASLVEARSRDYYGGDASAPAGWEPGGNEFFSPSLMEADLMRRVLAAGEYQPLARPLLAQPACRTAAGAPRTRGGHRPL